MRIRFNSCGDPAIFLDLWRAARYGLHHATRELIGGPWLSSHSGLAPAQRLSVVCIHLDVELRTRDGDQGHLTVKQLSMCLHGRPSAHGCFGSSPKPNMKRIMMTFLMPNHFGVYARKRKKEAP